MQKSSPSGVEDGRDGSSFSRLRLPLRVLKLGAQRSEQDEAESKDATSADSAEEVVLDASSDAAGKVSKELFERRKTLKVRVERDKAELVDLIKLLRSLKHAQEESVKEFNHSSSRGASRKGAMVAELEVLEKSHFDFKVLQQQQDLEATCNHEQTDFLQERIGFARTREQRCMDQIVVLLTGGDGQSADVISRQVCEDTEERVHNLEEKLGLVRDHLEQARVENRRNALRLSEEQTRAQTLNSSINVIQGQEFHSRGRQPEAPAKESWENTPTPGQRATDGEAIIEACGTKGQEEVMSPSSTASSPPRTADESIFSTPVQNLPPAAPHASPCSRAASCTPSPSPRKLEERLLEVLVQINFGEQVLRLERGMYKFGGEVAYIQVGRDGELYASHDPHSSMPLEAFLVSLSSRHTRSSSSCQRPGAKATDPVPLGGAFPRASAASHGDDAAGPTKEDKARVTTRLVAPAAGSAGGSGLCPVHREPLPPPPCSPPPQPRQHAGTLVDSLAGSNVSSDQQSRRDLSFTFGNPASGSRQSLHRRTIDSQGPPPGSKFAETLVAFQAFQRGSDSVANSFYGKAPPPVARQRTPWRVASPLTRTCGPADAPSSPIQPKAGAAVPFGPSVRWNPAHSGSGSVVSCASGPSSPRVRIIRSQTSGSLHGTRVTVRSVSPLPGGPTGNAVTIVPVPAARRPSPWQVVVAPVHGTASTPRSSPVPRGEPVRASSGSPAPQASPQRSVASLPASLQLPVGGGQLSSALPQPPPLPRLPTASLPRSPSPGGVPALEAAVSVLCGASPAADAGDRGRTDLQMASEGAAREDQNSDLLAGSVPCPAPQLASAIKTADPSALTGLLQDASVSAAFAAKLEAGCVKEICNATAAGLVEALGASVQAQLDKIHAAAKPITATLAKRGGVPSFKDVVELLPKGQKPGLALQKDWLLWHSVGHAHSPDALPGPDGKVLYERLALATCAGSGPIADCVLALHVLEHLEAYVEWEASLAGSQPPAQKAADLKGKSVLFPFDKNTAKEVSVRRVLASILPPEAAAEASVKVAKGEKVKAVVLALADSQKARAVIPSYVAPPAPKEAKDKGGKKGEGKEDKGGKKGAASAAPADAKKAPLGVFGQLHEATATQELQWHLLSYRLRPGTTLGAAAKAKAAAPKAPVPEGFAGIWAASEGQLPPGHTTMSWYNTVSDAKSFDVLWAPPAGEAPPGHTPYSWPAGPCSSASTSASTTTTSVAKAAPAAAQASPAPSKPAPSKPAAAPAKAAAAPASGTPEEGSVEAAFCKLDIRCGQIKECGRVPDADTLYLLKVDVGEDAPRQVVSSLVKFYSEDDLKNRQVVVYCNIKPGKMRNFESQAMVLAAVKDKGTESEQCELLAPPAGTAVGTHLWCGPLEAGSLSATQSVKHISKVWGQVQPLLLTNDACEATFQGTVVTLKDQPVKAASLAGMHIT